MEVTINFSDKKILDKRIKELEEQVRKKRELT